MEDLQPWFDRSFLGSLTQKEGIEVKAGGNPILQETLAEVGGQTLPLTGLVRNYKDRLWGFWNGIMPNNTTAFTRLSFTNGRDPLFDEVSHRIDQRIDYQQIEQRSRADNAPFSPLAYNWNPRRGGSIFALMNATVLGEHPEIVAPTLVLPSHIADGDSRRAVSIVQFTPDSDILYEETKVARSVVSINTIRFAGQEQLQAFLREFIDLRYLTDKDRPKIGSQTRSVMVNRGSDLELAAFPVSTQTHLAIGSRKRVVEELPDLYHHGSARIVVKSLFNQLNPRPVEASLQSNEIGIIADLMGRPTRVAQEIGQILNQEIGNDNIIANLQRGVSLLGDKRLVALFYAAKLRPDRFLDTEELQQDLQQVQEGGFFRKKFDDASSSLHKAMQALVNAVVDNPNLDDLGVVTDLVGSCIKAAAVMHKVVLSGAGDPEQKQELLMENHIDPDRGSSIDKYIQWTVASDYAIRRLYPGLGVVSQYYPRLVLRQRLPELVDFSKVDFDEINKQLGITTNIESRLTQFTHELNKKLGLQIELTIDRLQEIFKSSDFQAIATKVMAHSLDRNEFNMRSQFRKFVTQYHRDHDIYISTAYGPAHREDALNRRNNNFYRLLAHLAELDEQTNLFDLLEFSGPTSGDRHQIVKNVADMLEKLT